jgi:hypothetical protein
MDIKHLMQTYFVKALNEADGAAARIFAFTVADGNCNLFIIHRY